MGDTISAEEIERRIGRNVILFQRLESVLKHLLARSSLEGKFADMPKLVAERERALKMQTLGNLLGRYALEVHRPHTNDESVDHLNDNSEFSLRFYLGADEDFIQNKKSKLSSLVQERNDLIHQHLARYDENVESHRRQLGEYLEAQHSQLAAEYGMAKQLVAALHEGVSSALDLIAAQQKAEEEKANVTPNNSLQARRP